MGVHRLVAPLDLVEVKVEPIYRAEVFLVEVERRRVAGLVNGAQPLLGVTALLCNPFMDPEQPCDEFCLVSDLRFVAAGGDLGLELVDVEGLKLPPSRREAR